MQFKILNYNFHASPHASELNSLEVIEKILCEFFAIFLRLASKDFQNPKKFVFKLNLSPPTY